jgi:hypothetical protein
MLALMLKNLALLTAMLAVATAADAGATKFTLVNGTDAALSDLSIRRAGTQDWKPLGNAPAPGARSPIDYQNPDCAFDIKATVPGKGPVTWSDVNLCDVKSVTLKRDDSAGAWVDYDH